MLKTPEGDPNTPSQSGEEQTLSTSLRVKAKMMNIPFTTFCRNEKKAAKKRIELKLGTDGFLWSRFSPRALWSKIPPKLLEELREWITKHQDVHQYPLFRDMMNWIKDDGSKQKIEKLLITISIRELQNDIIRSPEYVGLRHV